MMNALAKPFGILLLWLYDLTLNYGVAVILFAIVVRLILLPFMAKSKKSSMRMSRLQPKIKELEKRHGANKMKYSEELRKLYRDEGVKPMSGCLWSLIPFPILFALYYAIRFPLTIMMGIPKALLEEGGAILTALEQTGFSTTMSQAYMQIAQSQWISSHFDAFKSIPEIIDKFVDINYNFLGMNIASQPQWNFLWKTDWSNPEIWREGLGLFLIPILAGLLSFISAKISMKTNGPTDPQQNSMTQSMMITMPLISLWIAFVMPASLGVYWIATTVLSIFQDLILSKYYAKKLDAEENVRREMLAKREAELEAKRLETERLKAANATVVNPNTSKKKQQKQERFEQEQRAAEWERKNANKSSSKSGSKRPGSSSGATVSPSQVGDRPYARGRAYNPDRYAKNGVTGATENTSKIDDKTPVIPPVTEGVSSVLDNEITNTADVNEPISESLEATSEDAASAGEVASDETAYDETAINDAATDSSDDEAEETVYDDSNDYDDYEEDSDDDSVEDEDDEN